MPKTREQKKEILNNLIDQIKEAKMIVWFRMFGLPVNDQNKLKLEMKKNNAKLQVVKKTLIDLAFKRLSIEGLDVSDIYNTLTFGFVFDEDFVPALKTLYNFSKDQEEKIEIIGGFDKERFFDATEVIALAKLPSKEVLLGKVVGSLNAPISNFVFVLNNTLAKLIWALNAIKEKKVAA